MLRHIFEHIGPVRCAKIVTDPDGRSRGFGFVEMNTPEDAAEAIARFNGDIYEGRSVTVSEARPAGSADIFRVPKARIEHGLNRY